MSVSSELNMKFVERATVALRERAGLLQGINMNASGDIGSMNDSIAISSHDVGSDGTVTPGSGNGPSTSADDFSAKTVVLNQFKNKTVTVDAPTLSTANINDALDLGIQNAIAAVINGMSTYGNSLYTKIPYTSGTAGQSIFNNGSAASLDPLSSVAQVLDDNDVPDFGQRRFSMSNLEASNYRKVASVQNANQMGSDTVRRTGMMGMDFGFNLVQDKRTASHTVGTITTGLATKAATAQSGVTALVCTTAATTGACALKEGDIVTVDSVTYALQADATQASAASSVTITLDRPLEVDVTGGEAVTIATGAGTGKQGIAGDMRGFGLFNRIEGQMASGMTALQSPTVITDPVTGISLLSGWYAQTARTVWEVSALYGMNVVQSKLLTRVQSL